MASLKHKKDFINALITEIKSRKDYLMGEKVNTIYFGGGTPSLLQKEELELILAQIDRFHHIEKDAEITLEANPDDLKREKIREIKESPVNRLSIGIQSFFDEDLRYLNRVHSAQEAEDCIRLSKEEGFSNLTIDLIYGIPGLTSEKWLANLEKFHSLDLPHLSAYSLTVEEKTALYQLIKKKKLPDVDENLSIVHFRMLTAFMQRNGYVHYEISNFAREGFYSRHNSLYWMGGNYLGLGPSAHSFNGISRQWNVASIARYIRNDFKKTMIREEEILSAEQRYNEYIMTSLRTHWGCDLEHIQNTFGKKRAAYCLNTSRKYIREGKLMRKGNKLFLTETGKLYADGIASELFIG
mgnify:CR=1 FL=1